MFDITNDFLKYPAPIWMPLLQQFCDSNEKDQDKESDFKILDIVSDLLYGFHCTQRIYARHGDECYFGVCSGFYKEIDTDLTYVFIEIYKKITYGMEGLSSEHIRNNKVLMFEIICCKPEIANPLMRQDNLKFAIYKESQHEVKALFEVLRQNMPYVWVSKVIHVVAQFLQPTNKSFPCLLCNEKSKILQNEERLKRLNISKIGTRWSLLVACDVCGNVINFHMYQFCCKNNHDICQQCIYAEQCLAEEKSNILAHYFPHCIAESISHFSCDAYYITE